MLRYLIEVEERRIHLSAGYSSMFGFCTTALRMSEGEAFRRITAARLAKLYPIVLELVETGVLHLSGLALLRDHLTPENHAELLREASGKSKRAIVELLAARAPKPDVPARIRKLPDAPASAQALSLDAPAPALPRAARPAPVEPLSAATYKVQFTASQALKDKLERARELLSHANPSGDLAVLVERAVDALIVELEKTRRGKTKRPRAAKPGKSGTIARAARREVFERDGEQCGFVAESGQRCQERAFLEIDHERAKGRGGSDETKNLRVRCKAHNRLLAERTFGKAHVEQKIHFRRRKCAVRDERFERLLGALTRVGFRAAETRAVLERIRSGSEDVAWDAPIETILRRAAQLLS